MNTLTHNVPSKPRGAQAMHLVLKLVKICLISAVTLGTTSQAQTSATDSSQLYIDSMYVTSVPSGQWTLPRTIVQGTLNNKLYTLQVTVGAFSSPWIFETEKFYPVVSSDGGAVKIKVPYKSKTRVVTLHVMAVEPLPNSK
jgi:hypothetical protein